MGFSKSGHVRALVEAGRGSAAYAIRGHLDFIRIKLTSGKTRDSHDYFFL